MRKNPKAAPTHSSDGPAPPMRLTPLAPAYQDTPKETAVAGVTLGTPYRSEAPTGRHLRGRRGGLSRLMGADEVATLDALTARWEVLDGLIASHGGRIANTAGDSVLAEFGSVGL